MLYKKGRYQLAFKINRKAKIGIISLAVIGLLVAGVICLMFMAKSAVNTFRADAANQLNDVIEGKDAGATVELGSVWLGGMLSSDYKKVDSLQGEYQKIFVALKNYVMVLDIHNQLVGEYNDGLKGKNIVNGDLLTLVKKYRDLIASKFPDETDSIAAADSLSESLLAASDFDSIASPMAAVISRNDTWLNEVRDDLNNQIAAFQKKIN